MLRISTSESVRFIYSATCILVFILIAFVINNPQTEPLAFKAKVFIDDGNNMDVENIILMESERWLSKPVNQLNFGYTRNPVWIEIDSEALSAEYSIVDLNFPQLDYVELFIVNALTRTVIDHQTSGDRMPMNSKSIQSEKVMFGIKKPEGPFGVYIRIQTDGSNQAPISIMSLDKHLKKMDLVNSLLHFFLGLSLLTVILSGISLYIYRDTTYLYYIILNLSISTVLLFHYRTINAYTLFFSIDAQHFAIVLSMVVSSFGGIQFVKINFIKWGFRRFDLLLKVMTIFSIVIICVVLFLDYQDSLIIVFFYLGLTAPLVMYMLLSFVITSPKNKYIRSGRSLTVAWGIFLTGAGTQVLGEAGLIYHTHFVNHGFLLGCIGIVLSMGLILSSNLQLENEQKIAAEKELSLANQKLYQADKLAAISTMSSGLIHEIKNPLNWTKASLTIALNEIDNNADLKELLDDSLEGVNRIEHIVQGLNWFAKSRFLALTPGVPLRALIERTLSLAKSQCAGILIANDVPENISVCGSETHLAQVIINILTNSIRAIEKVADQREGKIQISAGYMDPIAENGKDRVFISWVDNGIGIDNNKLDKLFDPFFTADEWHEGMGLGMTIAKQIIDKHEGSLDIVSVKNQWTRVNICLNQS